MSKGKCKKDGKNRDFFEIFGQPSDLTGTRTYIYSGHMSNKIDTTELKSAVDELGGKKITARVTGASLSAVYRWLRGERQMSIQYIKPLAQATDRNIEDFLVD